MLPSRTPSRIRDRDISEVIADMGHMAIVAPLPNNGNDSCDIGNAWPMTMCDVRCTSLGVLELKAKDKLECPYHPRRNAYTDKYFGSFTVALFVHISLRDQIAELTKREKEEVVVFVRQWVCMIA